MKKRVLSALLALCLTLSLAGAAFAENETLSPAQETSASESASSAAEPQKEKESEVEAEEIATAETAQESSYPAQDFEAEVEGTEVVVNVSAPEGALPEDVTLTASLVGSSEDNADDQAVADVAAELDDADVEYDGFVALDISFVDADGNKVEPLQPVNVNFTLPAELLPEDVDASTLEVQHLKENEAGEVVEVERVADTADATEGTVTVDGAAVALSEDADTILSADAQVTAEFAVDGFSTFTISWVKNGKVVATTPITCVDADDNPINTDDSARNIAFIFNSTFKAQAVADLAPSISGYIFQRATIESSQRATIESSEISSLQYKNGKVQYKCSDSHPWEELGNNNIVFHYDVDPNNTPVSTVETVNSAESIEISLFDYDTDQYQDEIAGKLGNFTWGGTGTDDYNTWKSGNGVVQGILNKTYNPENGELPTFSNTVGRNADFGWLFNKESDEENGKTYYGNLNNLFLQDTYTETGYYEYDSSKNYASLRKDESKFVVYDQPYRPGDTAPATPKFMPFNDLGLNYAEIMQGKKNYHFGMSVEFEFQQQKDGMAEWTYGGTTTKSPMVFDFSGDDDLWVFIDGVLVLDMGGVHDSQNGSIDFSTGNVTVSKVWEGAAQTKTLEQIFKEAKGEEWVAANMEDGRFKDYTQHTFALYYMERGGGGSNCRIKFNIPTIPKNSVAVTKQVTGDAPANSTYTMKFELLGDDKPTEPLKYGTSSDSAVKLPSSGEFEVQAGKTVYIYNVPENRRYKITEIGVADGVTVSFNGAPAEVSEGSASSEVYSAASQRAVVVTNEYPLKPIEPQHRKYVEYNDEGTYDLTLNATGTAQEIPESPTKVDLVYVLDFSRSMGYSMEGWDNGSYQRYNAVKDSVQALNNALSTSGFDVQVAAVKFWGSSQKVNDGSWMTLAEFDNQNVLPERPSLNRSTNYKAPLEDAQEILGTSERNDAVKVVVFVSDGDPNKGGSYDTSDFQAGKNAAAKIEADYFYAIGVGNGTGNNKMKDLAGAATLVPQDGRRYFASSDRDELVKQFQQMAADIVSINCSNVLIEDTLSQYAQLTAGAQFTVKITDASGNAIGRAVNVTLNDAQSDNGTTVYVTVDNNETIPMTVKYTPATEENPEEGFSLKVGESDYVLRSGWTYSITTQIEPTEAAFDYYREHSGQYPKVGEANTDAPDVPKENYISDGKDGFFSNTSATLTYSSAGQDGLTVNYNNPVIQVTQTSLKVTKVFKNADGSLMTSEQVVELGLLNSTTFTVKDSKDKAVATDKTLSANNGVYSFMVSNLYIGETYIIEETSSLDGYTVTTVAIPAKSDNESIGQITLAKDSDSNVVAFTNTYTPDKKSLTISKTVTGAMASTEKEFQFTVTLKKNNSYYGMNTGETLKVLDVTELGNDSIGKDDLLNATVKDEVAQFTFTLRSGEKIVLEVPYGYEATVSEDPDGYTATSTTTPELEQVDNDATVVLPTTDKDYTIAFNNHLDPVAPTGLEDNHTKPFGLMVGVAVMAGLALAGGAVVRRRRRWME